MAAAEGVARRFGENLKRCRRRVDLSQEQAGLRASLHRTEIGLLEHGRRVARIDTLLKLMAALEADARELLDGITWVPRNPQGGQFVIASRFERIRDGASHRW
jgi:transcriptional regulator with XRE-family HTH domain